MSLVKSNIQKLIGHVYINEQFKGSCIPCKINNNIYILTCSHVLYGDDFQEDIQSSDIINIHTNGSIYTASQVISDKEISIESDMVILTLEENKQLPFDFMEINLCSAITNPLLFEKNNFTIFPVDDDIAVPVCVQDFMKHSCEHKYLIEVDKETFHNIELGCYGSSAYKGVSGSGLFISHENTIYLSGILAELPLSTIKCQAIILNTKSIKNTLPNIEILDSSVFDEDHTLLSKIIEDCSKDIDENTVNDWLENKENKTSADNIIRKMTELYPKIHVKKQVENAVFNLLSGNRIIHNWEVNSKHIYKIYNISNIVSSKNDMLIDISTQSEARMEYKKISEKHSKSLMKSMSSIKVNHDEKRLAANRDISQWLAICDLDFI